jgi:N-acetylmuramoyl-L-alanine amidase
MVFKIAVDAGHYLGTLGKRCLKKLDAGQTREWVLNDRIARYFAQTAQQYEGVELLRVDNPTGAKDVSLKNRCKAANQWGADLYLSIHHNAGINGGSGGGIVAYSYKEKTTGAAYRDVIYDACLAAGGLRGNRAEPIQAYGFYVLKNTDAPAVLMEYGFMDSSTDVPVILTDGYAKAMAAATMEAIAYKAGLHPKESATGLILPVLRRGDKNETVRAMQALLALRGFPCDTDGSFGPATQEQVKAFLKGGVVCDAAAWAALLGVEA